MKNIPAITVLVMVACALAEYGVRDYYERAKERQALLEEARQYKTHPLVLNGCETDAECEHLDAMLAVIHASYE